MEPAEVKTAAELEEQLMFLAQHSSTGILRVEFFAPDGESVSFEIQNQVARTQMLSHLIDLVGEKMERTRQDEQQQPAPKKYKPKPGDVVTTPEVDYPMTVESFSPCTMTCALVGFAPGSSEPTRLPRMCALELTPVAVAE